MAYRLRSKPRRGVLLLVVLSLLVLFVLVGVTFIVVSGQYRRTTIAHKKVDRVGSRSQKLLDEAAKQLLRCPNHPGSVLVGHSLLEDMYGREWIKGSIQNAVLTASEQFLLLTSSLAAPQSGAFWWSERPITRFPVDDFYNGGVLTIASGSAAGQSTRIVKYTLTGPFSAEFLVEPLPDLAGASVLVAERPAFLINGRPFNGTGAGYDAETGNLDNTLPLLGHPVALLPNYSAYSPERESPNAGGADESYDAVDFQNMALAWLPATADAPEEIIPSFHRPELLNYWIHHGLPESDLLRYVLMRPNWIDNPSFSGSNPALDPSRDSAEKIDAMIKGYYIDPSGEPVAAWDVDNDGDGVPDSIWLDLGLPVQSTDDGRRYKALFAILCVDLDSRINLNAHGSLSHLASDPDYYAPNNDPRTAGTVIASNRMRGSGYGTPEVHFDPVVTDPTERDALIRERYGADQYPGLQSQSDDVSRWKHAGLRDAATQINEPTAFMSPSDIFGRGTSFLDHAGQLVSIAMGTGDEKTDDPYELNLNLPNAKDRRYTDTDFERLMRWADHDIQAVPTRLEAIAPNTFGNPLNGTDPQFDSQRQARSLVTTRSSDVPTVNMRLDQTTIDELKAAGLTFPDDFPEVLQPSDLFRLWMTVAGLNDTHIATHLPRMMAFELRHGEKMNINRLWGDGLDDDWGEPTDKYYGIVDDPGEPPMAPGSYDYLNDDPQPTDPRQIFARHVYCLLMFLKGPNRHINFEGAPPSDPPTPGDIAETAGGIAQWCINVVDFRDPDSIMTPFEYDGNPYDGWDCDGDITDPGGDDGHPVVWGCERPELLLTETLATHDRRVEDLNNDDGDGAFFGTGPTDDDDKDQRLLPIGNLFVEVYNPWTGTMWQPRELYRGSPGVKLDATTNLDGTGDPVWRLIIVKGNSHTSQIDPDDPTIDQTAFRNDIERSVFFTDVALANNPALIEGQPYFQLRNVAPLVPGRYAVIGSPGQPVEVGVGRWKYVSTIGRRRDATEGGGLKRDQTRRIELSPSAVPNAHQVEVFSNLGWPPEPTVPDIQPAIAVVVDQSLDSAGGTIKRPLSISEPTYLETPPYYPLPNSTTADGEDQYNPPRDKPVDDDRNLEWGAVQQVGTTLNFRTIHLQRLANPLESWHAVTNPYRTVDSTSVDLTVFEGVEESNPQEITIAPVALATFERGQAESAQNSPFKPRSLWPHEAPRTVLNPGTPEPPPEEHWFAYTLEHSLGYLNVAYSPAYTAGAVPPAYTGQPAVANPTDPTFPLLNWLNRPFVSHLELLQVPRSRSSRLLFDFTYDASLTANIYDFAGAQAPESGAAASFGHLLNFFRSPRRDAGTGSHLYRLFDYVDVPSRFEGVERWYNESEFMSPPPPSYEDTFRPPFNRLSRFRSPGLININTISDPRIWDALTYGSTSTPSWDEIEATRREYVPTLNGMHNDYPTRFANPFRAESGAELMPYVPDPGNPTDVTFGLLRKPGIEATLLRPFPGSESRLLFEPEGINESRYTHQDIGRNSYFRYHNVQRLSNLVTTHSNVFAVWITVGYFEVDQLGKLGQELGADTGQIERHRAFYIIDRSIPVAFEPGKDHNVDKAIVLKRFIE
jgi:hypothetical protein